MVSAGDVLDRLHELCEPALLTLAHGREGDTTVAEHDRCNPVPARGGRVGIPGDLRVEVGVHVDEARSDVGAARVDLDAAALGDAADRGDPFAVDRDVGGHGWGAVPSTTVPARITRSCMGRGYACRR